MAKLSDNELLIRIDERQQVITDDLQTIKRHVSNHSDKFLKIDIMQEANKDKISSQIRIIKVGVAIWSAIIVGAQFIWGIFHK